MGPDMSDTAPNPHYDAVGENLLAVLGEFAGEGLDSRSQAGWTDAYTAIKTIMLCGAKRAHPHKEKTMRRLRRNNKTPAQTDKEWILSGCARAQNNILLCDRNLVITYANSTAKRTLPQPLESEIKKCCRSLTSIRWWNLYR